MHAPGVLDHIGHVFFGEGVAIGIGEPLEGIDDVVIKTLVCTLVDGVAGDPLGAWRHPDGVVEGHAGHGAGGVGAVAVAVAGKLGVGAQNVQPALVPGGEVATPAGAQSRVVTINAGVQGADQSARAIDAEDFPYLGDPDGFETRGDADTVDVGLQTVTGASRARFHRFDEFGDEVGLDVVHIAAGGDLLDLRGHGLDHHQVGDPVAGETDHATGGLGGFQLRGQRILAASSVLQGENDFFVPLLAASLAESKVLGDARDGGLIGEVHDDADRLVSRCIGQLIL